MAALTDSPGLEQRGQTLRVQLGDDGVLQGRKHGQNYRTQTDQSERAEEPVTSRPAALTCHVTGPLVALEVNVSAGLSQVLGCLLLLHLSQLLLSVFAQEINT